MPQNTENLSLFLTPLAEFEEKVLHLAQTMGVNLVDYQIDHLALRANSTEKAKNWLTALTKYGRILSDNIVNGRPIYIVQLDKPLQFAAQAVDIIELPFPKDKQYPQETWEHIEIVMPFLANESTEQWINRINNLFLWKDLHQLTVKVSEPKVAGERLPNPSIAVGFADKTINHTCIKVHPYTLKKILEV